MPRRGKFITFEGLDGTGKSTQLRKLAATLRAAGHKVVETREPGGTSTGEKVRKVLLDSATAALSPLAEMALMFASRSQHIAEVIEPALEHARVTVVNASGTPAQTHRQIMEVVGRRLKLVDK